MVKHIVSWKLKEFSEGQSKSGNILIMQKMLISLKNELPMIRDFEIGIGLKNFDSSNFDIVLVSSFKTLKDLEAYLIHPEHKKVSVFINKIRDARVCIDYEY
jgi:hypothetical protein